MTKRSRAVAKVEEPEVEMPHPFILIVALGLYVAASHLFYLIEVQI